MSKWIGLSLVLVLSLVAGGCGSKAAEAPKPAEATPVRAHIVAPVVFEDTLTYSAITEPVAMVDLAFRAGGEVASLYQQGARPLEPGDAVPAGAVLATLRVTEFQARVRTAEAQIGDAMAAKRTAEAQMREAQAAVVQADADLKRGEGLFAGQAMTRSDLDALRARADGARARLEAARANVGGFEARIQAASASRDESAVPLGDTKLVAPFAGVVVARRVERGSTVAAGVVAYTLADLRQVKVSFGVPDVALRSFPAGASVKVRFEALPEQTFVGRVVAVAPVADGATRLFRVQSVIANAGLKVKAGMVGSVLLDQAEKQELLAVPLRAVRRLPEGESFAVMAVVGEQLQSRVVTLGPTEGSMIAIRSGLKAGEQIVADGGARLRAGDRVRVVQ